MMLTAATCCLTAYLVGSIPFGYLLGRVVLRDDIRRHGSGNIGATNVARILGWKWGSIVLLLDAMKGFLPTLATRSLAGEYMTPDNAMHLTIAAGVCAIVGHMYPVSLGLRGGKGVATALGVVLVVAPMACLVALAAFGISLAIFRVAAIASITAATAFTVCQFVLSGPAAFAPRNLSLTAFSVVIPVLIIWRHRSNIRKLLSGRAPTQG